MITLPRPLSNKRIWILGAVLVVAIAAYALFGFKVVPNLLREQAIAFVRDTYGRDLAIGEVRFNPFKLQLEVRDLSFPDAERQAMVSLRRLYVDFEVASLWRRAFVFKDVNLEAPAVRAVVRRDGSMNLADLAPPAGATASTPPKADSALPRVWIESLVVAAGKLDYLDRAGRERPFNAVFAPVNFSLQDFRTTPEGGAFSLSARNEAGARLDWKGHFALAPRVSSQGEFTLADLSAPAAAEFLGDTLPFGLSAGQIDLGGRYEVSLGAGATIVKLQLPRIELSALALRARGETSDWVTVPSVIIADTAVALPEQSLAVAGITVTGLQAAAWANPDGSLNLQQLFKPVTANVVPAAPTPSLAPAPATAPAAGKAWSVRLAKIAVKDAAIDFEDRMRAPTKRFVVAPVTVEVRGASLELSQPVQVAAEATINDHALFKVAGTLTPEPLAADLDLTLSKARLQILQPYVLPVADLSIEAGTVDAGGKLRLMPSAAAGPELSFAGAVTIDGFRSIDNALRQDLVNFQRLQVLKLRYEKAPDRIDIDRILVSRPYARVIVGQEQILNITAVLDPKGTAAELAARRALAATKASESKAEKRRREQAEKARARQLEKQRRKAGAGAPRPPPAPAVAEGLPIRIREVRIDGGRMNFSDFTVQPNFAAEILDLEGTVTGLSSSPSSRAKVDLTGNLGEFSPVVINGTLQPFAFDRFTDIGLSFENISLPVFNPYSGRFAGYNIAKGKLTTKLHYLIQNRKLEAAHNIRIDQLEWGETSANKGEATLPVKFATALLRDRNGVIDLDIPVTGSLDDPKLRIGPIVWQIIKNLIVKAVTAPFALLGSLFKGAEEAQFVDFSPGEATLDAATSERLATLAKGLVEKSGINLDVPIGIAVTLDRDGLIERRYRQQLATAVADRFRRRNDDPTPLPAFDALAPKQKIELLTALLKARNGAVPTLPEPPAPPEGTPRATARTLEEIAAVEFLEQEVRRRIVVANADLELLGQERAAAVQRALVNAGNGLEPSRIFLTREGKISAKDGKVRFELGLK